MRTLLLLFAALLGASCGEKSSSGELITLIDTANCGLEGGLAHCFNQMNYNETGEAELLRDFTTISSTFYPDLFPHYDAEHEEWLQSRS